MDKYLKDLLKILADEDDNIARVAMVELLKKYSSQLEFILSELQESSDRIIRRRCHQLEAYLSLKERREAVKIFIQNPEKSKLTIIEALINMHLLWFDKDSLLELKATYQEFIRNFQCNSVNVFAEFAQFMRENKAVSVAEKITDCELYLLGTVIDSRYGCGSFWCALSMGILESLDIKGVLAIRIDKSFLLFDPNTQMVISPGDNWKLSKFASADVNIEKFNASQLIKYLLSIIFANAVNADEFRYIYITGSILKQGKSKNLNFLPYPYGKLRN